MTTAAARKTSRTPDSHDYPTRSYDLVKEFVIALALITGLSLVLAGIFSSPDDKAITMSGWAKADPSDAVATAAGELAGTTTSATYGAPYNHASEGQSVLGLKLQKWGGVGIPVNSADLVLQPLRSVVEEPRTALALAAWTGMPPEARTQAATAYADALAQAPDGDPAAVAAGRYGPVPYLTEAL